MPASGWKASAVLVLLAMSLLIPWNVVGTIWQIFGRTDIGLFGAALARLGIDYNYTGSATRRLAHRAADGRLALDAAGRAALLRRPARDSRTPTTRPRSIDGAIALRRIPLHPAAQAARRADDRRAAALHGQLHDLHRAVRADRRRTRQLHDVPVAVPDAESRRPVRPGPGGGVFADLLPDHPAAVLHPLQLDAARRHESTQRRHRNG